MKIAGEHPLERKGSSDLLTDSVEQETQKKNGNLDKAKLLGNNIAKEYIKVCHKDSITGADNESSELEVQKILLLSFTVMGGFEQFCPNMTLANAARASFFDKLHELDLELFEKSSDTGAFSFYYLCFRRGTEVDRRVGQTFAMLCSHDGDPIYQELGEALYCWFLSRIEKSVEAVQFVK